MMDNVADMIALLDPQGNRTWCNPAYGHMMGCEPQEMNGIHALAEVHPEDKAKATEALDLTLKEASVQQAEYRVQRKDGAWLTLHTETIPILNHENHIESVLLLAKDRTEEQKNCPRTWHWRKRRRPPRGSSRRWPATSTRF